MRGKKFRFSLESVLNLRTHETECARQDLASIRQTLDKQEQAVRGAEAYLSLVGRNRKMGVTGRHALSRFEAFRQDARRRLEEARQRMQRLQESEEEARLRVVRKKGEEEAIRRLREHEEVRFWEEYRAHENQALDEQAIAVYQRKHRSANT